MAKRPEKWKEAAVLILCYQRNGEEQILFTRRTDNVLHHKGQICFPGGASDRDDGSLWETALRETREEIGLDPSRVTLVKELSPQRTPTGFRVTPFVVRIDPPANWAPNPIEIAEIFAVPLKHLKDRKNVRFVKKIYEGKEYLDPHFTYGPHEIWGVTGRILYEFLGL